MTTLVKAKWPTVRSCIALCMYLTAGCDLPRDPAGTSERVGGGIMHVGVMHHPPWIDVAEGGKRVTGIEATLIERLADELSARVQWHPAGESLLMESLKNFELDLVVGGLSDVSIWKKRVGLTQPYVEAAFNPCSTSLAPDARLVGHVFAVPPGENAWL